MVSSSLPNAITNFATTSSGFMILACKGSICACLVFDRQPLIREVLLVIAVLIEWHSAFTAIDWCLGWKVFLETQAQKALQNDLRNNPDAKVRMCLVYPKYCTLILRSLMVYPKVLFRPNLSIKA